jgi:hypothetical protein
MVNSTGQSQLDVYELWNIEAKGQIQGPAGRP